MSQQRRAQVTRHAIVVAAAEEFDLSGYDATPLSAILRRGGVTKGAFYFHFPSKEAVAGVLVRFQNQSWSRLCQRWTRRGLDPLSTAIGLTDEVARLLERDVVLRAGLRLSHLRIASEGSASVAVDWEKLLGDLLAKAAQSGLLRSGVDPTAVARVVHAALVGVRTIGFQSGAGMSERGVEVWRVLLDGVATADWRRTHRLSGLLDQGSTS